MEIIVFISVAVLLIAFVVGRILKNRKGKATVIDITPGSKPKEKPVDIPLPETVTINWPDRRPVGMIMLADYKEPYKKGNRNWTLPFDDFKSGVMQVAEYSIMKCREMNAQAVIVWNIEGEEYPKPVSYIGDPTQLNILAPEMNLIADEFFDRLKSAGLKVGVCIRPDDFRLTTQADYPETFLNPIDKETKIWAEHYIPSDPYQNIKSKVEYAKKRWGCQLFYVDSNVGEEYPIGMKNTIGAGEAISCEWFEFLQIDFPDCLFIPEKWRRDYFGCAAPFGQTKFTYEPVPKNGFMAMDCSDTTWSKEQMTVFAQARNILMGRVWWDAPELTLIKQAYDSL